jgi:hypothetical protein
MPTDMQRAEQQQLLLDEERRRVEVAESELARLQAFLQESGVEYPQDH